MSVSIVMAAYNAEKTIAETLDSLIAQTYSDKEIIVTNDGSEDSTGECLTSAPMEQTSGIS
jgi:glycosyltransferase involved in cell wall biosynthesis